MRWRALYELIILFFVDLFFIFNFAPKLNEKQMKLKKLFTWTFFLLLPMVVLAQQVEVTGVVKDVKGEPLLGVFVLIKGTQRGATTDIDGKYSLQTKVGDVLTYSFLGMKNVEKKVEAGVSRLNIVMQDDIQELEETVVTGYGTRKVASKTVASVAQVQSKEFAEAPTANAMDALMGRVAGMVVVTPSGKPGESSSVTIHGYGNLYKVLGNDQAKTSPLFVMDGVPVSSNVMTNLNANDIESITVLKDAASTSIYGARAANGVVYITTKRGKRNERTRISINHQVGFSTIASRKFFDDLMSPEEYMDFWSEKNPNYVGMLLARRYRGTTVEQAKQLANSYLEKNPYHTRWDKLYYRNFVPLTRTDVSISGGTNGTSYYFSMGYFDQEGNTYGSDYKRYTLSTSIDTDITKWLKAGVHLSIGHNETNSSNSSVGNYTINLPFYSPIDEEGKEKDFITSILGPQYGVFNPKYLANKNPNFNQSEDILPIGYLTAEPIKNLVFKTQMGVQFSTSLTNAAHLPSFINYNNPTSKNIGNASESNSRSVRKTITNTLEYKFKLGKLHNFTALLGQESIENNSRGSYVYSEGQSVDGLVAVKDGTNKFEVSQNHTVATYNSYFGRVEYNLKDRYFLDISGRRDGSSTFSKNHRYANFWAVGAMWRLKEEAFLKNVKWLTDLNLRFSTGSSGNPNGGGDYSSVTEVRSNQYDNSVGYEINKLGNPDLLWEQQQKTTLGLNVVIARGTSFNIEYYDRKTRGALSSRENDLLSGFGNYPDNVADMSNKGVDFSFSSVVYRSKNEDLTIRPYFNVNYNESKVLGIFDGKKQLIGEGRDFAYAVDNPIYYALPMFKGVNPDNGKPEWYLPGEDKMNTQTDDSKITNTFAESLIQNTGKLRIPPVNGGFGLNVSYKAFTLDASFNFTLGKWLINQDRLATENPNVFGVTNHSRKVLDYWKQPGDNARNPRLQETYFTRRDSRLLEDASFLRLRNISLSYRMPEQIVKQIGFFDGIRLYGSARNVFVWTKYTGADPEYDSSITLGGYLPTRQFTFGVELKF